MPRLRGLDELIEAFLTHHDDEFDDVPNEKAFCEGCGHVTEFVFDEGVDDFVCQQCGRSVND